SPQGPASAPRLPCEENTGAQHGRARFWRTLHYLQHRFEQFAHFGWIAGSTDTASFHDFELGVSSIVAPRNQRAGVAHPLSRRRSHTGNETYYRFRHVVLRPPSGFDFVGAANFTDHDNGVGVGIFVEHLQYVDVLQTIDGVTTNADGRRLAQAQLGQLSHGFV